MENGDLLGGAFKKAEQTIKDDKDRIKMKKDLKEKSKMSRDQIMAAKDENDEFRSGKKFMKARGAAGKIHRKHKGGKSGG
jgi:hypothetical protein